MRPISTTACVLGCLLAVLANANAAPAQSSPEDRYIVAREAAIKKLKPLYDDGKMDDAGTKVEDAARADLAAQLRVILGPVVYTGYGPGKVNLGSLYEGDEGYGTLDGLRFDADIGKNGQPSGRYGPDGKYVEPKAHIIVTTQTLFARWLRAHKDWWDKDSKNVPQQIGAAVEDESFYTQAIETDAAVVKFSELPIAKPASATLAYGFLAARTQSEVPNAADEVFVSAISNGKVYVAYSTIEPEVRVAACEALRAEIDKRSEQADEDFRQHRIDEKTLDTMDNQRRQSSEDAFKQCFAERAQKQSDFADAVRQAQALLEKALGR